MWLLISSSCSVGMIQRACILKVKCWKIQVTQFILKITGEVFMFKGQIGRTQKQDTKPKHESIKRRALIKADTKKDKKLMKHLHQWLN